MKRIRNIQLFLSRKRLLMRLFVKIRNQLNMVIAYHITDSIDFYKNGENMVLITLLPDCKLIIDVGANEGQYIKQILKLNSNLANIKIQAFEPGESTYEKLKKNIRHENIKLHNLALSDRTGVAVFYEITGQKSQASSLYQSSIAEHNTTNIEVKVDTLDNFFFRKNQVIDFIKIDTEGNDFKVLVGASNLLSQKRVNFIQFEYNTQWLDSGSTLKHTLLFLKERGYSTFLIRPEGLYVFDYSLWGDFFHYANFLAVANTKIDKLNSLIKNKY
jgi:FkbM family methyltransferase